MVMENDCQRFAATVALIDQIFFSQNWISDLRQGGRTGIL